MKQFAAWKSSAASLAWVAIGLSGLAAQSHLVVPASGTAAEGPGLVGVAGIGKSETQQYVIDQAHLQAMLGRSITGLQFRRDTNYQAPLAAGTAQLTVRLGIAPRPPHQASPHFADNLQNPVDVFTGSITIPASSAPPTPAPWTAAHAVQITFAQPFLYTGGHLCVELVGAVTGNGWWWPVDGVSDFTAGFVQPIGSACGPFGLQLGRVASVAAADLVPGQTALFTYRGTPSAPVLLALGAAPFAQPIDLAILGASGCSWWLDPIALIPTAVVWPLPDPTFGGFANVRLQFPSAPALLSATFAAQWLEASIPLIASEALTCQFASSLPTLGITTIFQEPGATQPIVHFTTTPVMRFDWQ